jgi:hypothetical protein
MPRKQRLSPMFRLLWGRFQSSPNPYRLVMFKNRLRPPLLSIRRLSPQTLLPRLRSL